ncbi:MAG: zinc transporter ZupT, partial [Fretibacterium sp.]|nr:zinc transporter ZupT [Fretibacterium sp.]
VVAFFTGIVLVMLIDKFVPSTENPHEAHRVEELNPSAVPQTQKKDGDLMRTGVLTALAIAIHNFPEGIATFMAGLQDPGLGVPIAVAIAMHNIPEGIAVSVPIYYATGSRKKAFCLSFLSGLAEPIGALLAFLVLTPFLSETLFGLLFAGVAGIMVFISVDQLLPAARQYGEHHISIYGLILGMAVMAVSLLLLE